MLLQLIVQSYLIVKQLELLLVSFKYKHFWKNYTKQKQNRLLDFYLDILLRNKSEEANENIFLKRCLNEMLFH